MRLSPLRCTLFVLLCLLAAPARAGHYDWFRPNAVDLEAGWLSNGGGSGWTTAVSLRVDTPLRLLGMGCEYRFFWGREPLPATVHQSSTFLELHPLFFMPMLLEHPLAVLPALFYVRASLGPAWVTRSDSTSRVLAVGYGGGVDVPLGDPTHARSPTLWVGLGFLSTHLAEYGTPEGTRVLAWSLRLGMNVAP